MLPKVSTPAQVQHALCGNTLRFQRKSLNEANMLCAFGKCAGKLLCDRPNHKVSWALQALALGAGVLCIGRSIRSTALTAVAQATASGLPGCRAGCHWSGERHTFCLQCEIPVPCMLATPPALEPWELDDGDPIPTGERAPAPATLPNMVTASQLGLQAPCRLQAALQKWQQAFTLPTAWWARTWSLPQTLKSMQPFMRRRGFEVRLVASNSDGYKEPEGIRVEERSCRPHRQVAGVAVLRASCPGWSKMRPSLLRSQLLFASVVVEVVVLVAVVVVVIVFVVGRSS